MQMKKKYFQIYLFVSLLLCSAVIGCQQDREEPFSGDKPLPHQSDIDNRVVELLDAMNMYRFDAVLEAPSFELLSVTGEKVALHQYRGKVVLLSFWATW
jgi:hypothetical protein